MKRIITIVALLAFNAINTTAWAGVTVLDFDEFDNGQVIDDEYLATYGVQISSVNRRNSALNDLSVAFDTSESNTEDPDLEFDNSNNDYNATYTALEIGNYLGSDNPGNVLILQENQTDCHTGICTKPDDEGSRPAGYFEFNFSSIVSILNIDFFDIEDQALQDAQFYAIHFFDENDNEIHTGNFVPTMGDGQFVRTAFNGINNVKRLILNLPGSGAIDNLAFKTIDVPAPATIGILSLGLLIIIRRVRK